MTSDPNYPVLHDFFEFTNNGGGMNCDTTMVDQFAIPLAITLAGSADPDHRQRWSRAAGTTSSTRWPPSPTSPG